MRLPNSARVRAGMLLLTSALAGGCASLPPVPAPSAAAAGVAARPYQETIDIAGRLSLRYDRNGSEQALDGKFTWTQADGLTRITLLTPFGQTLATIDVTPRASTLRQADRAPRTEPDVDALTASALGWPLPIAGLRDWLQGFALDAQGARHVAQPDATGDATWVRTADGWLIHYAVWDTDPPRPRRIDLQRVTSQAGTVALRIVIDQWQPH